LADEIKKWSALNVVWVNDTVTLPSTDDDALMNEARSQNRILVTEETRLDETKFKICTHPGIIIFRAKKRHSATKAEMFRLFMLSGYRPRAKKAVTVLKVEDVTFRELDYTGDVGHWSCRWDEISNLPRPADSNYCGWRPGKVK
jgi:hypothetical protein